MLTGAWTRYDSGGNNIGTATLSADNENCYVTHYAMINGAVGNWLLAAKRADWLLPRQPGRR